MSSTAKESTKNLILVVMAKEDAYGVVQEGEDLFHIKPPFSIFDNKERINPEKLQFLIKNQGYEEVNTEFSSYPEIEAFLKEAAYQSREDAGEAPKFSTTEDFKDYFRKMPPEVFKDAINDLEEAFNEGDYEGLIFQAKSMLETVYHEELQEELKSVEYWLEEAEKASMQKYKDIFPDITKEDSDRAAEFSQLVLN